MRTPALMITPVTQQNKRWLSRSAARTDRFSDSPWAIELIAPETGFARAKINYRRRWGTLTGVSGTGEIKNRWSRRAAAGFSRHGRLINHWPLVDDRPLINDGRLVN